MKKVLLVTFSDNADHQDISFGMFESIYMSESDNCDIWIMGINNPKVPVMDTPHKGSYNPFSCLSRVVRGTRRLE